MKGIPEVQLYEEKRIMLLPKWMKYYTILLILIILPYILYFSIQFIRIVGTLSSQENDISFQNLLQTASIFLVIIIAGNLFLMKRLLGKNMEEEKSFYVAFPILFLFVLLIGSSLACFSTVFPIICYLDSLTILFISFPLKFSLITGSGLTFFYFLSHEGVLQICIVLFYMVFIFIQIFLFIINMSSEELYKAFSKAKWSASELSRLTQRIVHLSDVEIKKAQNQERIRISREIHDVVGYSLTAILVQLDTLHDLNGDDLHRKIQVLESLTRTTLNETRLFVKDIRQAEEFRQISDWMIEINTIIKTFANCTGMRINLSMHQPLILPGEEGKVLYHCIQEAINNAYRHGNANYVSIQIRSEKKNDMLLVKITDNGLGCTNVIPGSGLSGIKERVNECGGDVIIIAGKGKAFTIYIDLPMHKEEM